MADRIEKKDFVRRVAARMGTDEALAAAWVDGMLEEMYTTFESRHGLTLPGFGGFYLERRGNRIAFKFNPGQRLRALFGLVVHVPGMNPRRNHPHPDPTGWRSLSASAS
jgi:nucleoid DNA-binding protein